MSASSLDLKSRIWSGENWYESKEEFDAIGFEIGVRGLDDLALRIG